MNGRDWTWRMISRIWHINERGEAKLMLCTMALFGLYSAKTCKTEIELEMKRNKTKRKEDEERERKNQKQNRLDRNKSSDNDSSLFN